MSEAQIQKVVDNSFVRVIISLTTSLALIALCFRMWLYSFWIEYKNQKTFYLKLMELQEVAKKKVDSAD